MQISSPCGTACWNCTVPPWAFTICRTNLRPRPCSPLWVLETSVSWFSASSRTSSIPTPSSATVQVHRPSSAPTVTEIWHPWGLWTMLLRIRLSSIRRRRAVSPSIRAALPGCSSENAISNCSGRPLLSTSLTACRPISARSTVSRRMGWRAYSSLVVRFRSSPGLVTGLRGESVVVLQFTGVTQHHGKGSADVVGYPANPLRPGVVLLHQVIPGPV